MSELQSLFALLQYIYTVNLVMKGSIKVVLIVIVASIVILAMVGYIFLKSTNSNTTSVTETNVAPTLAIPVKDFAPGMPTSQKTTILIESSDSSEIKYIVPTSQVQTYIKNLPAGYRVISKSS